jgi:hypothetical protein
MMAVVRLYALLDRNERRELVAMAKKLHRSSQPQNRPAPVAAGDRGRARAARACEHAWRPVCGSIDPRNAARMRNDRRALMLRNTLGEEKPVALASIPRRRSLVGQPAAKASFWGYLTSRQTGRLARGRQLGAGTHVDAATQLTGPCYQPARGRGVAGGSDGWVWLR